MNNIILSAHNKPFKLKRHAENAIKDRPGYIIANKNGGFVGIKEDNNVIVRKTTNPKKRELTLREVDVKAMETGIYQDSIIALKKEDRENKINKDLSGLDVFCPSCGLSYFTTTKEYNPDIDANPAMLDLKPQYKEWGWEELPKDSSMGYGCISCPGCGSAMAPSGRVRVKT